MPMPPGLEGKRVVVSESRELDLLEAEGATVTRCPMVRILDVEDYAEVDDWLERSIAWPFDDLVLFTGEGVRRLTRRAETKGLTDKLVSALKQTRTFIRGPKPARALREIGLSPTIAAPSPTSRGLIAAISGEVLRSHRVGVQLYPGGGDLVVQALIDKGADVETVT